MGLAGSSCLLGSVSKGRVGSEWSGLRLLRGFSTALVSIFFPSSPREGIVPIDKMRDRLETLEHEQLQATTWTV